MTKKESKYFHADLFLYMTTVTGCFCVPHGICVTVCKELMIQRCGTNNILFCMFFGTVVKECGIGSEIRHWEGASMHTGRELI